MNRKKAIHLSALAFGAILVLSALLLEHLIPKALGGVMIGVGAGLFSVSAAKLYQLRFERKNPELAKQSKVEEGDERNAMIRSFFEREMIDRPSRFWVKAFHSMMGRGQIRQTDAAVLAREYQSYQVYLMVKYLVLFNDEDSDACHREIEKEQADHIKFYVELLK